MANVLINGFQAKSGGGKIILYEFIKTVFDGENNNNNYTFIVPNYSEYKNFEKSNVKIISFSNKINNSFLIPFVYFIIFPKFISKKNLM